MLFHVTWMAFVVGGPTLSGQSRPSSDEVAIEKKLVDGKKYMLLGDWDKAEALFRAILEEDVLNSAVCYELSRTLAAQGNYSDALTYVHKAIRIEDDNEWYLLMEADIQEKAGDIFATMEVYDRLIKLRPKQSHYYEMQISLCKRTGEKERLLKVLDQYELERGLTESITRTRFETLDELGRKDEALAALHRLTVVYSTNLEYKFLAASYAIKIGKQEEAGNYYEEILKIDPTNSRAKLALAGAEKEAGDNITYLQSIMPVMANPGIDIDIKLKELIPYVITLSETRDSVLGMTLTNLTAQLIKAHPRDAKPYAVHGDVLSIRGQNQAAVEAYIASTKLNGGVYPVWEQLLSLLIRQRSYDELIRQAENAILGFPNQAFLYYAAGYGMFKTKAYDDALEILNEALIMTGRNAGQKISVLNVLGLTYDELGDLEKSAVAFESALSIDPKSAETLAYYSLTLSRRIAQSEKAMAMTDKALGQRELSPAVHEVLAQVLYNQKKYNEAYTSIQVVLGTDPYGDAYNLAGDILNKLKRTPEAVVMWQRALDSGCTDTDLKRKISDSGAQ